METVEDELRTFLDVADRRADDCREASEANCRGGSPLLGSIVSCHPIARVDALKSYPSAKPAMTKRTPQRVCSVALQGC
jgi:hypothetical protein